jgi:hypothetical protein
MRSAVDDAVHGDHPVTISPEPRLLAHNEGLGELRRFGGCNRLRHLTKVAVLGIHAYSQPGGARQAAWALPAGTGRNVCRRLAAGVVTIAPSPPSELQPTSEACSSRISPVPDDGGPPMARPGPETAVHEATLLGDWIQHAELRLASQEWASGSLHELPWPRAHTSSVSGQSLRAIARELARRSPRRRSDDGGGCAGGESAAAVLRDIAGHTRRTFMSPAARASCAADERRVKIRAQTVGPE